MQDHQGQTNAMLIDYSDDLDPELLYPGLEEEEEEEEDLDPDDEPEEEGDGDRGDDLDPDMPPEDDDAAEDEDGEPAEEQEPDEEPAEEQPGSGKKPTMVPHARFNEVNESLKAERAARLQLEEELARARGAAPKPEPEAKPEQPAAFDFDAAEDRYTELLMEGDTAEAKKVRAEIRAQEKAMYVAEAQASAKQSLEQERAQQAETQQKAAVKQVLGEMVAKYPFLDHEAEGADAEAILDVVARRDLHMSQGMNMADAIRTAVTSLAKRYKWDGEQEPEPQAGKKPAVSREKLERNLERSKQVPERLPGVGGRNTTIDFEKLSEDEFASLSAREKAIARGDVVKGA